MGAVRGANVIKISERRSQKKLPRWQTNSVSSTRMCEGRNVFWNIGRRSLKMYAADEEVSSSSSIVNVQSKTFIVELSSIAARRQIVLEKFEDLHYISAVATGSEAEEAGIVPGMVLRAVSDPIEKGEMWRVRDVDSKNMTTSSASLRNVKDAISSTRQYNISFEFENDIEVTAEMVQEKSSEENEDISSAPIK